MGEGCSADCSQCHAITQGEASAILKDLVTRVVSVGEGPIKGMWEVQVDVQGKQFPIYLHYSKKFFFTGSIIDIENKKFVTSLPSAEAAPKEKVDFSHIPVDNAIVIGKPTASKKVIVFDDPDCPFCRKLHPELKDIVSKREDIAFYIKLFPLVGLHPQSYDKSKAIVCSKSFELLDEAFSGKDIPPASCETMEIDNNIELAAKIGISGTPTLIFNNGEIYTGYVKSDDLITMIDSVEPLTGVRN